MLIKNQFHRGFRSSPVLAYRLKGAFRTPLMTNY